MFGKLKSQMSHKAKVLANKASRAVSHKVNKRRNHGALRDLIVELKSFPKAAHRAVKYYDLAILEIVAWAHEYAAAPKDAVDSFRGAHESLIASVDAVTARATEISGSLEALLEKAKESDAASKEATKAAGKEKTTPDELKALEERAERLSAEVDALTKTTLRAMVKDYGSMCVELYTILASAADKQAAMLEAQYPGGPAEGLPYEALWDEARPATGAKAAKPPPASDGAKRKPYEDLAALSRPVDGDTRIKYAKQWNGVIRDVLKPVREGNTQWVVYAELKSKFAKFFVAWATGDGEDDSGFKAAADALTDAEGKFIDEVLKKYQDDLEGTIKALEKHLAVIPVVNAASGEPDVSVPPTRPADAKDAVLIATKAAQTLAETSKQLVIDFGNAAMPTLPQD